METRKKGKYGIENQLQGRGKLDPRWLTFDWLSCTPGATGLTLISVGRNDCDIVNEYKTLSHCGQR